MKRFALGLGLFVSGALALAGDPVAGEKKAVPTPEITPVSSSVIKIEPVVNASESWAKAYAEAKTNYSKTRDYSGHMIRQERVGGKVQTEQTAELRVRVEPFSIATLTLAPKALFGQEICFASGKKEDKIRVKPAGIAGVAGFVSVAADDAKAMVESKQTILNTGIHGVMKRIDAALEAEKTAKFTPQLTVAEYKFNDRPCTRFEINCDKAHAARFAHRMVVYIDAEWKLPVRFEAYEAPKTGTSDKGGELIECVSFVNLKLNSGLGDATFDK